MMLEKRLLGTYRQCFESATIYNGYCVQTILAYHVTYLKESVETIISKNVFSI